MAQAATLGVTGCNPMCDGLQPYVRQARLFDKCLKSITFTMVSVEAGNAFLRRLAMKVYLPWRFLLWLF